MALNNGDSKVKKLVFCSLFVLTACGGGSSKDDTGKVENLAGIWDASEYWDDGDMDEIYIHIDSDGYLSSYDFAGDTLDNWGNCYWIDEKYAKINHIDGNKYQISSDNSSENIEVEIRVSNKKLTIKEADIDDLDDDGNTTEMVTTELEKSSKTIADFTPECVDSEEAARALIPAKKEKVEFFK